MCTGSCLDIKSRTDPENDAHGDEGVTAMTRPPRKTKSNSLNEEKLLKVIPTTTCFNASELIVTCNDLDTETYANIHGNTRRLLTIIDCDTSVDWSSMNIRTRRREMRFDTHRTEARAK